MTAEILPARTGPDVAAATLDDLIAAIRREHAMAMASLTTALEHGIRAGEALLAARELIPRREWRAWITDTFGMNYFTAARYIRFATYKDTLRAADVDRIDAARTLLVGLPNTDTGARRPQERIDEATRLRGEGLTYTEIGELMGGLSLQSVARLCNYDEYRERARLNKNRKAAERREAKEALRRQERDATVRRAGGSVADAYSLIRRALQTLEQAHKIEQNLDAKKFINTATHRLYDAEDLIVKASRNSKSENAAA